jgi:hypothetical protein
MHPASLFIGALLAAQVPQTPPPSGTAAVVSVDRIRAALGRPTPLRMPDQGPKPDFVVHIIEKSWFERTMPPIDFRSGPVPPGGLYAYEQQQRLSPNTPVPLFSVPLLPIFRSLAHSLSNARDAQSSSAARREVTRAVAEYCAAQPNGGTAIALCMNPTAIR